IIMVEKTSPDAWTALETPFIYAHNTTLMSWTGLSRSTLQRHIRELAEARLLVPQDGRNGQRGRRWQAEEGQTQVGFNLASLRYRWP
ncbi:MAG: helix-turn-helix domain-containing protein, partial [Gluconobacter sp.]